jgi:hypothetical protein
MSKALITAGNINTNTFSGVCYAISQVLTSDIQVIHILDTEESAQKAELVARNQIIRKYLNNVEIRSSLINDKDLQQNIPARISALIREFGVENVYVDLSNGQKLLTGVFYAVATISQIPNIYAIQLSSKIDRNRTLEEYKISHDWDYIHIEPLSEIKNISQSSQIELIFYRDNIRQVIESLEKVDPRFARDSQYRLENSLTDYFSALVMPDNDDKKLELLERCINGIGKISEDIAIKVYDIFSKNELIKNKSANSFNSYVDQISGVIIEIKKKNKSESSSYPAGIDSFLMLGEQLKMMQVYRNFSSHSDRRYTFYQRDARLALDVTLLILDRIAGNQLFRNS